MIRRGMEGTVSKKYIERNNKMRRKRKENKRKNERNNKSLKREKKECL